MTHPELEMLLACMFISSKFESKKQVASHSKNGPITRKDEYASKWEARKADSADQHHDNTNHSYELIECVIRMVSLLL